jgi:hypothetical protein
MVRLVKEWKDSSIHRRVRITVSISYLALFLLTQHQTNVCMGCPDQESVL